MKLEIQSPSRHLLLSAQLQTSKASPAFRHAPPHSSLDHAQPASLKFSSNFQLWHSLRSSRLLTCPLILLQKGKQRCEYGTIKSSSLKEPLQRWHMKNAGTPATLLCSWLPALLLSKQQENPHIPLATGRITGNIWQFCSDQTLQCLEMRSS